MISLHPCIDCSLKMLCANKYTPEKNILYIFICIIFLCLLVLNVVTNSLLKTYIFIQKPSGGVSVLPTGGLFGKRSKSQEKDKENNQPRETLNGNLVFL